MIKNLNTSVKNQHLYSRQYVFYSNGKHNIFIYFMFCFHFRRTTNHQFSGRAAYDHPKFDVMPQLVRKETISGQEFSHTVIQQIQTSHLQRNSSNGIFLSIFYIIIQDNFKALYRYIYIYMFSINWKKIYN